jgi:predicted nucleic-acid-binding Zn-ribbon protein
MFKEQDTITITGSKLEEEFTLATKQDKVWTCHLCVHTEEFKVRILNHLRFDHIVIK